ncbi:MAG TPA: SDR family NAD(P)-dependent oxidoreductase [Chloroflexota bacterium]|nr:SDR family NAD(P)-dependent oxidoreductase [Chloroflexota bacterium]
MANESRDLAGQVAIVTGGASGIARATSNLLAQRGAQLAMFDINDQAASEFQGKLRKEGIEASYFRCNVTSWADVDRQVRAVADQFGQIDILVNVVGGSDGVAGAEPAWIWEMSEANWDGMFALNLKSTFLCCRAVTPVMMERRRGSIVNVSSGRGATPAPQRAHYSASKAGVMALTKTMAAELASYGIRVNSVAPGVTGTERARATFSEEAWHAFEAQQPMGRIGEPEDLAEAIVFLASPRARHITGQILHVNGGNYMP